MNKKKTTVIIVCAVLLTAVVAIGGGLLMYFTSPAYSMQKTFEAIKNKDGDALEKMILPDEIPQIERVLEPLELTVKDLAEPLSHLLSKIEESEGASGLTVEELSSEDRYSYLIKGDSLPPTGIAIDFKKQDGAWYFAPMSAVRALPVELFVNLISCVRHSDVDGFLECLLPSEKLLLDILTMSSEELLKSFLDGLQMDSSSFTLTSVESVAYENGEYKVTIDSENGDFTLTLKNHKGRWYLSVTSMLGDLIG